MVEQDLTIDRDPGPDGPQAPPAPAPGKERRLGDYRILREIGRGGMGVVYEAEQVSLGRRVALKVLPGQVAGDRMALERFRREAKAAARLHHTNIVPVFEVGRDGEVAYYAMQFIQGQGLDQVIDELARLRDPGRKPGVAQGPGPTAAAAATGAREPALGRVAESLLTGRLATEGAGAVRRRAAGRRDRPGRDRAARPGRDPHLGLRPRGSRAGRARPDHRPGALGRAAGRQSGLDGRISRAAGRRSSGAWPRSAARRRRAGLRPCQRHRPPRHQAVEPPARHAGVVWIADFGLAKGDDEGLTQTGDILGTLRYMAPERFRGEGDARADVYALGLTLYELLTLRPGFDSSDRLKLIEQIKTEEPPRPRSDRRPDPARPGDDRPEGDREGPQGAVPVGRGDGRGPAAVPGRRADPGPPGQRRGALLAVGPAQPGDRGAGRGAHGGPGRGDRRLDAGGFVLPESCRSESRQSEIAGG